MKRQPVAGVDFDPDAPMCQDDYEWYTSTGQYEGDGWAEWKERQVDDACRFCRGVGCYYCTGDSGEWH